MLKTNLIKFYCTNVISKSFPKPFESIPTLKYYPILGHNYLFLPWGPYKAERLTEAVRDLSKKLGPIFRLNLGGTNIIITTNPDNARILYGNEGNKPIRPPFPALVHYRKRTYNSVGVVPGNGDEWYKYRKGVTPLLKRNLIEQFIPLQIKTSQNFVEYIEKNRNSNLILNDIYQHLLKFSIEAISIVSPGVPINCILENKSTLNEIIQASNDFMDGLYKTLKGPPLWKLWKTTGYKQLETSHKIIENTIKMYLIEIKQIYDENPDFVKENHPYIYTLLKNFNWNDVIMLAMEIFLGGIDATSTTITFTLYHLAKDKNLQKKVKNNFHYLYNCVKETLRMYPTAGANSRFLINDVIMNKFLIPKNTLISIFNSVISTDEIYFKKSLDYIPERWDKKYKMDFHRFASLPFGHGARMCPGRRIAENSMVYLLKEILNNYEIELSNENDNEDNPGMVYRMNRVPDRSISIKFKNTNY